MTLFTGTGGNELASVVPAGFVGWITGVFADLNDVTGDTFVAPGGQ